MSKVILIIYTLGKGPLYEWSDHLLNEKVMKEQGFFNTENIRLMWKNHVEGKKDNSSSLWNILMFQAWLEKQ